MKGKIAQRLYYDRVEAAIEEAINLYSVSRPDGNTG